jgi:hypothetical protein
MKKLTAEAIDKLAEQYLETLWVVEAGKTSRFQKKAALVKLAKQAGFIPPGAEKSLRLEGLVYLITASFGTSSSIDEAVVQKIREYLIASEAPALFNQLFHEKTAYIVAPTAPAVIASLTKSPDDQKLRRLIAKVMTTKPKEPSLKVEKKTAKKAAAR